MAARRYPTGELDVLFDPTRCIHSAECVRRLGEVFDPAARPWIKPDVKSGPEIAEVVQKCPTGALHYEPSAVVAPEEPDARNSVRIRARGPLYIRGNIQLKDRPSETRVALCRCGASKRKPFCDNSHLAVRFADSGMSDVSEESATLDGGAETLTIEPLDGGPLQVNGRMQILNAAGTVIFEGIEAYLCRCGHSQNKPFCDGSHNATPSS